MTVSFPLLTDRLLIEPMTIGDAERFAAYRSDPGVARFQSWDVPYPLERAQEALAANPSGWPPPGSWTQLAIREGDELRGDVGVHLLDDPVARDTVEVGVTLTPGSRGRGLATEALRAVVDACFAGGAHRVVAGCDARNHPVARLFERVGLRHEARLVDAEWWKDEWTTADTWAVLASEWRG
jgi:RimJ/RimL family protein N-acetyltransferase